MKKKIFSILMAVLLVCCFIPAASFAVDGEVEDGQTASGMLDVSKSKTATNLDENFESQVTLSLPSASYKSSADVVLVIDISSSMKDKDIAEAKEAAKTMCDELSSYSNVDIKVGIVTFDKVAHNLTEGLVTIKEAENKIDQIAASSDTNMMAGLIEGKRILDAGSGAEKYMVLMSDGIPIYWVDDSGDPICKTLEWYAKDGETLLETRINPSEPEGSYPNANNVMPMNELLAITDMDTDSNTWKVIGDTGEQINSGECRYTNIQKATYMTAKYIQSDILNKYDGIKMVAYGTDKYENNAIYTYGENFCDWIGSQNGVSYYKVSKPGYGGEEGDLSNAFSDISNELIQVVDRGSYVIDEMGDVSEDYNFDFVNDITKIDLTVGGEKLDKYEIGDSQYGFGAIKNDEQEVTGYRYVLTYYKDGMTDITGTYGECFKWEINEAITKDRPVQLTYSVRLTNPKTEAGEYGKYDADGSQGFTSLYTNNEAKIWPVDTKGNAYAPESFPKPTVSYTVEKETPVTPIVPSYTRLTVQKVWKLDDGGTAADSVKVQLTRNGIPYGEIKTLSADEGWTADWYVETGYSYDVVELDVPEGFTSSVEKAGYTFTVTNDDVKAAEPEQPDEPAVPDEPDTPDTPDTPDEPQTPDQPEADDADTDAPQTGDAQDMGLWFVLLAVTAGGLGVTLRLSRKQR